MAKSSSPIAELNNKIANAFRNIGIKNGTQMPPSSKNTDAAAYELYVADTLYKQAEGRRKLAQKAAVEAGVLFDHEINPREPGTKDTVYTGDIVVVLLNVRTPTSRVNVEGLVKDLTAKGVKKQWLDDALIDNTVMSRAPHTFTPTLIQKS